jgi:hypothetical protein
MIRKLPYMSVTLPIALAALSAEALAVDPPLPADRGVRYTIRENPTDPDSNVIWTIDLTLAAVERVGNEIGWSVTRVSIADVDESGNATRTWTDESPEVATPDGLWWVEHADPDDVALADFAGVPVVSGLAGAGSGTTSALEYAFDGVMYGPDPGEPLFGHVVTALSFALTLEGSATPEHTGAGQPATVDEPESGSLT